jgi:aspartate/methionine/tyrosine aminotransferase
MRLSSRTVGLVHSPIGAAHGLLADRVSDRALLDLSQAAPSFPPAPVVADRVAAVAHEPDGARYAPQPGLPALRDAFACDLRTGYGIDALQAEDTLITAGCNQAFCLAIGAIAEPGDQVVVVEPFYFNHDMWLRVQGIEVAHVPTGEDQLPDVDRVAATITDRTRAIVVVSPGNPTGVTIEPARIHALAELARSRALTLIIDETYRNFRGVDAPPHALFADPEWRETVISLHSFSKDFAIPGYRVGAIVGGAAMLTEALKLLDCVAISAPRIGMEAALAGLVHASDWRREQAERIAGLQLTFESVMAERPAGFELVSAGAYFGWVRHPFAPMSTVDVVRRLVHDADMLVIPGTAFTAVDEAMLRFSFANLTTGEIDELGRRLVALT